MTFLWIFLTGKGQTDLFKILFR